MATAALITSTLSKGLAGLEEEAATRCLFILSIKKTPKEQFPLARKVGFRSPPGLSFENLFSGPRQTFTGFP